MNGHQEVAVDLLTSHTQESEPIDLHVHNLNYSVTDKPGTWWQKITNIQMPWEWLDEGKTTHILRDVTFTAKSGKLMAIMGGSGSGKTSLLDVLACRTNTGEISGDVYLNSVKRTKNILDSCAGYVRQDDRLIAFLTVRETLMFVAHLQLPSSFTRAQVAERVDRVIAELGLKNAADTKVGNASIRGLSGGERRRVSIGIQLLIQPSILFLDEPTSGLDSFTANNITQTLSRLAQKSRTVVISLHQPRFDIFNLVDVIMILSKGRIVYNGPAKNMISYFTDLGYPCPEHVNPCDFYIDLATVDSTSKEQEEKTWTVVKSLHDAYRALESGDSSMEGEEIIGSEEVMSYSQSVPNGGRSLPSNKTLSNLLQAYDLRRARPGVFTQFAVIYRRFFRMQIDDWPTLLTHAAEALFMSLLLGTAYVGLKLDQGSLRDWFGVMFMMSVMYPYMVILGLIGVCHEERKSLYFELQDKLYSPVAYYFAKVLSDVPFHLILVVIYCIPVYYMAGLKMDMEDGVMFYLFVSVSVFCSRCLAMFMAALAPTFQLSCVLAQTLFSLFIMCSGFLINVENIIPETRWVADISYIRWGFQALCLNQIEDLTFECNKTLTPVCVETGQQALGTFGFADGELWQCWLGLGGSMAVFLIGQLLALIFIPQKPHDEG